MKEKLYKILTLWVTLSSLFFIVVYATNVIDVVTLGGLFAGSFMVGLMICLGLWVRKIVTQGAKISFSKACDKTVLGESWLCMAVFCHEAVLMTSRSFPGWTYEITPFSFVFVLVVLPCISVYIDQIIYKEG